MDDERREEGLRVQKKQNINLDWCYRSNVGKKVKRGQHSGC